ncbi:eukaryotic membrane protein family-domain-containing protein [Lipomyces arxii]|uniref:eukaryotic membrane protein family-domain-containing protein n=1 Tax=Lipomyces arxii TaxID=56418 RepID=UPI0034CE76B8
MSSISRQNSRNRRKKEINKQNGFISNLWSYLQRELSSSSGDISDSSQSDLDQIVSFLLVPFSFEKVLSFGFLTCLDSFLYAFTILPLRFTSALSKLLRSYVTQKPIHLEQSQKVDLVKTAVLAGTVYLLSGLNASILYHKIRGQSAVKLYVMYNVLEIGDKLFCSLGQDITQVLYSSNTLSKPLRLHFFVFIAIMYNLVHSAALFCQMITLNVAVNSYSNALLTLLLSNQFSEIKSAVFKKFERENLFQLTCADISERFQLWVMLVIIGHRNIVEVSSSSVGVIPQSWSGWNVIIGALFGPASVVLGSEVCVDWLKHSYIAKFNKLKPAVYSRFLDVFCKDHIRNAFSGQQNLTRRIGVPLLPLACVFVKSTAQTAMLIMSSHRFSLSPSTVAALTGSISDPNIQNDTTHVLEYVATSMVSTMEVVLYGAVILAVFAIVVVAKLLLGSVLLEYSRRRIDLQDLRAAMAIHGPNKRDLDSSADETVSGPRKGGVWGLIDMSDGIEEDLNKLEPDEEVSPVKQKPNVQLQQVERFSMVAKRIW